MLLRYSDKADRTSVRRKGWADIVCRVRGQPHVIRRTDLLDVDIEVVLLFSVPGKGHLIAVRGKAGESLKTRVAGEWDDFNCRLRFAGGMVKDPSRDSYRYN